MDSIIKSYRLYIIKDVQWSTVREWLKENFGPKEVGNWDYRSATSAIEFWNKSKADKLCRAFEGCIRDTPQTYDEFNLMRWGSQERVDAINKARTWLEENPRPSREEFKKMCDEYNIKI